MMNEQIHNISDNSAPYLEGLNTEQRQAVETLDGPLLVLAGAGTGKTRVLTARLAHILSTNSAYPGQILSVTFTNKAAAEMKERVSNILGGRPVDGWWLGTFHSLSSRMLRENADLVGLKSNFTILDSDDQIRLIKKIMEEFHVDPKKWAPRLIHSTIQSWKDKALAPTHVPPSENTQIANGQMVKIYKSYQERLKNLNACDFGDLLLHVVMIFKDPRNASILSTYHNKFKYFLVDEYQDTNVAQYLWLRLLAQGSQNICCVGDDDQSIYGWRGAEIENILRFSKDFPNAKTIKLEQNYRSTTNILNAANAVISKNQGRLGKNLWSANEIGEKIQLNGVWDGKQEAQQIGDKILKLHRNGHKLNEIAILVRAGFQTREFEERFMTVGVPYRVIGGPRFYERLEIRDALAYLRITAQPEDDLAFERIINKPKRGLGNATLQTLHLISREKSVSLSEAVHIALSTDELKARPRKILTALMADFDRWRDQAKNLNHAELAEIVLEESGYIDMWKNDKAPEAAGRLENLKELINAMSEFENMEVFLEHISLVMEHQNTNQHDMATIMTLHSAKGLEFDSVFLPGWEEGVFPNQRTLDESGREGLEEERRLAYVGITRAKKRAFIYHAANRQMYGRWVNSIPSRFIDDLPDEHIEVISAINNQTPAYGGGRNNRSHDDGGYNDPSSYSSMSRGNSAPLGSDRLHGSIKKPASENGFNSGDKVMHKKFGQGTVINADGDKLDISFDRAGRKKILDSFVEKL